MDAYDVVHQRRASFLRGGLSNNIYANRSLEQSLLNKINAVVAIQLADTLAFRQLLPTKKVIHIGQAFSVCPCLRAAEPELMFGFLASESPPNSAALQEIIETIWPRIHREAAMKMIAIAVLIPRNQPCSSPLPHPYFYP